MKRDMSNDRPPARMEVSLEQLMGSGREMSAATIMFHTAVGERAGLSATEHKALDILARAQRLTAGELADSTGLTTGAVTGLVDRLETMGFVRRVRDTEDRRKVFVEPVMEEMMRVMGPAFEGLRAAVSELYEGFSPDQRRLVHEYHTEIAGILYQEARKLSQESDQS